MSALEETKWIEYAKEIAMAVPDQRNITGNVARDNIAASLSSPEGFNNIFGAVNSCLFNSYNFSGAQELLIRLMKNAPSNNVKQISVALQQVIEMYSGQISEETLKKIRLPSELQSYKVTSRFISWENYWRYFFDALPHLSDDRFRDDFVNGMHEFSKKVASMHFIVHSTYARAFMERMHGFSHRADSLYKAVGSPVESDWMVYAPFKMEKGFVQKFEPELTLVPFLIDDTAKDKWATKTDDVLDGYLDLKEITGAKLNSTIYALLPVYTSKAKIVQMRFGSNRALKVWLNNEQVFIRNQHGEAIVDEYIFSAKLKSGVNWIMVRQSGITGEFGLYFRITNKDGMGFKDIYFDDSPVA